MAQQLQRELFALLEGVAGRRFYDASPLDFGQRLDDPGQVAGNLCASIAGFSPGAREVIDKVDFEGQIARLATVVAAWIADEFDLAERLWRRAQVKRMS